MVAYGSELLGSFADGDEVELSPRTDGEAVDS